MSPTPPPFFSNSSDEPVSTNASEQSVSSEPSQNSYTVPNKPEKYLPPIPTVMEEVDKEDWGYFPPKPRFAHINLVATFVSVSIWIACVVVAMFQEIPQFPTVSWLPSSDALRIIAWVVLIGGIVWAVGMNIAVALHNRTRLNEWVNEVYGFELPKHVLFVLGLEDVKFMNMLSPSKYYRSEDVEFESPEGIHKLVVIVDEFNGPVLLDLNTGSPMKTIWEMYEKHVYDTFAKDLWREKGRVIYTAFTVTPPKSSTFPFAILVWSDESLLKEWVKEALEVGLITEEQLDEDYILEGKVESVFAHHDWMLEEYEDCRERGLIFGINWDELNRGLLLSREEFNELFTTGSWNAK